MRRFLETVVTLITAMLMVGTWLVEPYSVVSGSMHPTLLGPHYDFVCAKCGTKNSPPYRLNGSNQPFCSKCRTLGRYAELEEPTIPGDGVLVDRTAFWFRAPRRGEVICFHLPNEESKIAVKRVIGLPGERIELREGKFWAGDEPIALPTTVDYSLSPWDRESRSWQLGADEYFVAGDNPPYSEDSRWWRNIRGVSAQLIVGKPVIVHAPRRLVHWFGRPFHVPDVTAIRYIR